MTHLVHVDSELCPPLGHTQSEHCVGCHRGQGHSGIGGATAVSLDLKGIIVSLSEDVIIKRGFVTRIPQTSDSSKKVGTTLKTRADSTKLMPRDPRSIVLDRAPVCLLR